MKTTTILYVAIAATILTACSNDNTPKASGVGELTVEFDNVYGANDLVLNTPQPANSANEHISITGIKYIVSNIVLTKDDGSTFVYPQQQSYFIVDEADAESQEIHLSDVPAGDYTKVTFGIGVDQARYELGEAAQQDFANQAQAAGLLGDWENGYTFLSFQGTFTSASVTTAASFVVTTAKTPASYNYFELTLPLPEKALVRKTISPEIHIFADTSKILSATHSISLESSLEGGTSIVNDAASMVQLTQNAMTMFAVNHVHNEPAE